MISGSAMVSRLTRLKSGPEGTRPSARRSNTANGLSRRANTSHSTRRPAPTPRPRTFSGPLMHTFSGTVGAWSFSGNWPAWALTGCGWVTTKMLDRARISSAGNTSGKPKSSATSSDPTTPSTMPRTPDPLTLKNPFGGRTSIRRGASSPSEARFKKVSQDAAAN